ncbi:MAG: nucleoside deaminase [Deltaproteobacteria bacterium]|nr:nucleoside deaminase [Deltaproteobacteria bacterium]
MKTAPALNHLEIKLTLPDWVRPFLKKNSPCSTDEEKMRLAVALARENVLRGTGGPVGAAVFRDPGPELLAVGVNGVERLGNSVAHAEMVAIMLAEQGQGSYTLRIPAGPKTALFTTCEPCAMCLGAVLWSGLTRLVCGAPREAALALGFEEGPVFPESYRYLEDRGVEIVRGVLAGEARAVLRLYQERSEGIYNG